MRILRRPCSLKLCPLWSVLVLLCSAPQAGALAPSVFGAEMDRLWADFYNRDDAFDRLLARAEALWPRTLPLDLPLRLREQTHLRFFQGMVEMDREAMEASDRWLALAEDLWQTWLRAEPTGRVRVVGVEIRSLRMVTRGWFYALTNALALDGELQRAFREAPEEPRVRVVAAMKYHYAPFFAGRDLERAVRELRAIPDPSDDPTHFLKYYELALCLEELGRPGEAREAVLRCLSLYPRNHLALEIQARLNSRP